MKIRKSVYVLPNGKALDAKSFCRYFEKKVLYTVRKFGMQREAKVKKSNPVNSNVLMHLYEKFGFAAKDSKTIALDDSTDDIAASLLDSWFSGKTARISPADGNKIRPFYLMTEKEIEIYASLKHIGGKPKKKNRARQMLDEMEKKHPEVKRAIVQSWFQLLEIRNR